MNKKELIEAVSKKLDFPKKEVARMIDSFLEVITETLKEGEKVSIPGWGVFYVTTRKARKGRNVRTGEIIEIPEKRVVKFRPGKKLSDAVAG